MIKMHPNVYSDLGGCGSWMGLSPERLAELLVPPIHFGDDPARFFKKLVFGSDCYVKYPGVQDRAKLHYEQILSKVSSSQELRDAVMGGTVSSWIC